MMPLDPHPLTRHIPDLMATFLGPKHGGVKRFRAGCKNGSESHRPGGSVAWYPMPVYETSSGKEGQQQIARKHQEGEDTQLVEGSQFAHGRTLGNGWPGVKNEISLWICRIALRPCAAQRAHSVKVEDRQ